MLLLSCVNIIRAACECGLRSEVTVTPESHLVGSTGWVECICSTHEQRVVALLQENLDEIVAFVLEREEKHVR